MTIRFKIVLEAAIICFISVHQLQIHVYTQVSAYFSSLDLIKFLISLGETLSFIRGCSKGKTDISVSGFHNFSADNQTACQYYPDSQDHLLACITWCQEDFCNGPLKYIKMVKEYTGTSSCSLLYTHKRIYTYLVFLISGILLLWKVYIFFHRVTNIFSIKYISLFVY